MAFETMAWAVKQKVGSATGKAILLMLANYADANDECYPSQRAIAEACECSEKTVYRWLDAFESMGIIERTHRQRKDGSRTSDQIRLTRNSAAKCAPEIQTDTVTDREIQTDFVSDPNGHSDGAYTITETITNKKTKQKRSIDQRYQDETDPLMVEFLNTVWAHCWRKGDNRKTAFKAFAKLNKAKKQALVAALPAAKRLFSGKENEFRPMMATWINRDGWEEIQTRPTAQSAAPQTENIDWEARISHWRRDNTWLPSWGPRPGEHGCKAPSHLTAPKGEAA